jgi:hypothetical protein
MNYLFKYAQAAYSCSELVQKSRERSRHEFEYRPIDTGVSDQHRDVDD